MTTTTELDTHQWLEAIDQDPELTTEHLLAAYHHLGVPTDLTKDQLDELTFRLQLAGFLWPVDINDDGSTYTYAFRIPDWAAA